MALYVDSFDRIADEIFSVFSSIRDSLAVFGAYYVARKSLTLTGCVLRALKTHAISRIAPVNLVKKYGPWAVVTGSTHGIGKAYAQELAAMGVNIVIVSIDSTDCDRVAASIVVTGSTHGIGKAYAQELAAMGVNIVIVSIDSTDCDRVAASIVVTGCTGGIGQEYCMNLAASGVNLVLISRSQKRITELAEQIEQTFHVQTATIAVDFNDGRKVYDVIRKGLEGKEIGILVNNVGVMYDYPMYFLQVAEDKLWQLVHCNVAAATMMTHMILPQMVQRGRGAVINMASGASSMPAPLIAVYSATKAYLDYLSRALSHEYAPKGITVQCVRPFYVATRMTQYSETLSNPNLAIPSAATFARHALRTLGWADRTTGYWPHTLQSWMTNMIPEWLWMWGATRLNMAFQRQATHRIRHRSGSQSRSRRPSGALLLSGSSSRDTLSTSASRENMAYSSSRENLMSASASREKLPPSASRENLMSASASKEKLPPSASKDNLELPPS